MLFQLKGLVEKYAKDKTKEKALKAVEEGFRESKTGVCPYCGEKKEVSRLFFYKLLKEKGSHPQIFPYEATGICEECAYVLYLLSTLTYTPRFFASTKTELVEIESEEQLKDIPPMGVVVFSYAKGNRLPSIFTPVVSPLPRISLTLNVVAGSEWFFFHVPTRELLKDYEGYSLKAKALRSLKKYVSKEEVYELGERKRQMA